MARVDDDDQYPSSSSSSIDSNTNNDYIGNYRSDEYRFADSYSCSSSSRSCNTRKEYYSSKDLSTDLKLGLSISSLSPHDFSSTPREQYSDWPPVKTQLRSTLACKSNTSRREESLYVKVYLEGIPIGRKLDLLAHDGYHSLITTLSQMFRTTILFPEFTGHNLSESPHILTYEDKEGDWMMVGDVPWGMFLSNAKRLKIAKLDTY